MHIILTLIFALLISHIFTLIAKKLKVPTVVALILAGLFLGSPYIRNLIIEPSANLIFSLGDIALLCLMFLAGLESSWDSLYHEKKDAFMIAISAALIPFISGFAVFRLLGFSTMVSLIVGICMSITAEATKARVLLELKKLKTKVGSVMIGAGIIDDVLGLSLFILVTYFLKQTYIKEDLLVAGSIAAFLIGLIIQKNFKDKRHIKYIEKPTLLLVVPFLFISMGIHFDFRSLFINHYILAIMIVIAIIGKIAGTALIKPFTRFNWKQIYLIGWGMNSRGAVELALALIALRSSLIPVEIYSSIVIMTLTTTLLFPFIITHMIKKDPKIMS